jgi:hypothetical protein
MRVTQDDAGLFFRLMWGLQLYVNQRLQVLPKQRGLTSIEAYARLDMKIKIPVRDALWKQPELIDAYAQANPERLPAEELAIVSQWQHFIKGSFTIFRYLKGHAIFMGDTQIYAVKALFDPFDDVIPDYALPVRVDTVLLPFKGQIVYDGVVNIYAIAFGGGIREELRQVYMSAKEAGRIISSLEGGAPATLPAPAKRKLMPGSEGLVTEIAEKSKALRGGTEIAELAVLHPESLDELVNAGAQASRALTKLRNAVGRADYS